MQPLLNTPQATKFSRYTGSDMMGLAYNHNYQVYKWSGGDVLLSAARRGNAMSCHFAARKSALRELKTALNEFAEYIFEHFDWCRMIMAFVAKSSIERLIAKVGFEYLCELPEEGVTVWIRGRNG